jgi:AraC family transcriptional regulator
MAAAVSEASLRCRTVIPTRSSRSSRDIGWTSLLLDLHTGVASNEPYTSVPTPDPRVGVTISGRYSAELFTRGRWRHDTHGPGSINLHRTGEASRYRFPEPEDPGYLMALVYYPLRQLEDAAEHMRRIGRPAEVPHFASVVERDPAITQMTFALVEAMSRGESDLYAETAAAWLAVHMLSRHGRAADRDDVRSPGTLSDARLARVIDFMSAHYAEPLSLDRLAAEACISKYHFTRLFHARVGRTPRRFLADVRLDAARRMLAATDLPAGQIGVACGFPAASHFSAAFTARYGVSPTAFRKRR